MLSDSQMGILAILFLLAVLWLIVVLYFKETPKNATLGVAALGGVVMFLEFVGNLFGGVVALLW